MKLANIRLKAGKNLKKGDEVNLESLFPWQDYDEVRKVFELSDDVKRGMPIAVEVEKLEPLHVKADIDKKKGQKPLIGLWMLLSFTDLRREITVSSDIAEGAPLEVTVKAV
jgi:hypothetical protein